MTKKVAISQSNYIPWKGYFDMIASVDVFVLYDDMQYTKRDWRNRNKIKTESGSKWLSVPVNVKGKYYQKINETIVSDASWQRSHLSSLQQSYKSAPGYRELMVWLEPIFQNELPPTLSEVNRIFIDEICGILGITTQILDSRDFELADGKTERLANLCSQLGASEYVSGPAAKSYIDESCFSELGIQLSWADYTNYPEYNQLWGKFEHSVTILDLLFNVGVEQASAYMKYLK